MKGSPRTINHSPIIPLGSSLGKSYIGYCILVSVPEMQVLCVGVQVILASRLFHGLGPAVAKVLSPTFTRRVVARRGDPMKCQPDDVG
jgi:hypothetical protein